MPSLIRVPLGAGGSWLVGVSEDLEPGVARVGREGEIAATERADAGDLVDQLKPMATAVIDGLRGLKHSTHRRTAVLGIPGAVG